MTSSVGSGKSDGRGEGVWKPRILDDVICERSHIVGGQIFVKHRDTNILLFAVGKWRSG